MNKKLIAAAIAAAVSAPAAMADVTVYGKLHVSVDSVDEDTGTYSGQAINSRDSRIGFKGSEDLGNGLKAVWKFESKIGIDQNDGITGGRDAYLGLAGNFGTFLVAGSVSTPYKNSTAKMDFFADTIADQNNTIGTEDNRANNALVYISPKFSGLQFTGAAVSGEGADGGAADGLADAYSVAATYNNAGISAAIAYENMEDLADGKSSDSKVRVGLGYKMDAFKVAAVYESKSDIAGAAGADANLWQISAAYTMGNNTLKAMYGNNDTDTAADEKDGWAIGVDHKMSKRTQVYALYVDSEQGLRGDYDGTKYTDGSAFSIGMVHSF